MYHPAIHGSTILSVSVKPVDFDKNGIEDLVEMKQLRHCLDFGAGNVNTSNLDNKHQVEFYKWIEVVRFSCHHCYLNFLSDNILCAST